MDSYIYKNINKQTNKQKKIMSKERKPLYFLETVDQCRINIYEEVKIKSADRGHMIVTLSDKLIGFIPTECLFVLSKCQQEV